MAQEPDLAVAAEEIENWLRRLADDNPDGVLVFESSPGNLRAIIASDKFKGVSITKRQNDVWKYLRTNVSAAHLHPLFGVHIYDLEEFAREFPGEASGAISLFISGIRDEES
jgi:stress-induced morphogen